MRHQLQEEVAVWDAPRSTDPPSARPLQNVCIWVDGRTEPSREALKLMVARAGGRFETYFHRVLVTHVVGTHFPRNKVIELRRMVRGGERGTAPRLHVVRPEWVVDSVQAGTRLPEWKYAVSWMNEHHVPGALERWCRRPGASAAEAAESEVDDEVTASDTESGGKNGIGSVRLTPDEPVWEEDEETDATLPDPGDTPFGGGGGLAPAPDIDYTSLRSSRENANFVREFFAQSRLHFIGSFRNTYEAIVRRLQQRRNAAAAAATASRAPNSTPHALPCPGCYVLHVDMDAFFVSVSLSKRPYLRGQPVAVCHSGHDERSRAEISSASYEARACGVHANLFFGEARKRCPQLVMVPYEFGLYRDACEKLYAIFFDEADLVQGVSIDEAYLLVQECATVAVAAARATRIRQRIRTEIDGCTASIGIGVNRLLARLATRHAKEHLGRGEQYVFGGDDDAAALELSPSQQAQLDALSIHELPCVGWSTRQRLLAEYRRRQPAAAAAPSPLTVGQLRACFSRDDLQQLLGGVLGTRVHEYAHGIDRRPVETMRPRQSVSAQIAWGVRFDASEADRPKLRQFVGDLARVVLERMHEAQVQRCGSVTVSALRRRPGAGPPYKPLGCGECLETSVTRRVDWHAGETPDKGDVTAADEAFVAQVWDMFIALRIPSEELRGVGVHARKLHETANAAAAVAPVGVRRGGGAWRPGKRTTARQRRIGEYWTAAATSTTATVAKDPVEAVSAAWSGKSGASSARPHLPPSTGDRNNCARHPPQALEPSRPPAPPGVDRETWHALPRSVAEQVYRERCAWQQLQEWRKRRGRSGNAFQPTLLVWEEMRRGRAEHNGAVLLVAKRTSSAADAAWRVVKRAQTAQRRRSPADQKGAVECIDDGQDGGDDRDHLPSMAECSLAIDTLLQRVRETAATASGDEACRRCSSLLADTEAQLGGVIEALCQRRQWATLSRLLRLVHARVQAGIDAQAHLATPLLPAFYNRLRDAVLHHWQEAVMVAGAEASSEAAADAPSRRPPAPRLLLPQLRLPSAATGPQ